MSVAGSPTASLVRLTAPLARAYAAVLFCESPWVGGWFALMTWWSPRAALAGLVGLIAAALWARLFALSAPGEPHLVNGLLSGLFLGAFHAFGFTLLAWIVIVALFVTLSAHWLARLLWRAGKLPVLSFPFVIGCWAIILASGASGPAGMRPAELASGAAGLFWPWLDDFFAALGWLLLVPYPLAGALLFAGLMVASRYLALLALAGYVAGQLTMQLFDPADTNYIGFNFMLAAMALGGIFAVPSRASFVLALAGGALAGWFSVALGVLLHPLHLPLLTLPFLLAVWLWLGGLGSRATVRAPQLTLDHPTLPEIAYERARLAHARGGAAESLPLLAPIYGEWRISQGFDGAHTHRPPWQHALDFHITEGGRSHSGSGTDRNDYFCFGVPILAPAAAQVIRSRDDLPDVLPGEVDVANNWGNFLLLRVAAGAHVLLAHLKQNSLRVRNGEWVAAGQPLAACGSSGRSPEPHLHLHLQVAEPLGSPTRPFHLANVLVRGEGGPREFQLYYLPAQGETVSAAPRDELLAAALHLPPGRQFAYRLRIPGASNTKTHELRTELTLLGQPRLVGAGGASAAYEEAQVVLGLYDRQGSRDPLLDLWLLALGLTPLSAAADRWGDRPSMRLLPLGLGRRLLGALLRPLGGYCDSRYRRGWDDAVHAWRQDGEHSIRLMPGIEWRASTSAWIEPGQGVRRLRLDMFGRCWHAELEPGADGAHAGAGTFDETVATSTKENEI